jgi:hypothetical protein
MNLGCAVGESSAFEQHPEPAQQLSREFTGLLLGQPDQRVKPIPRFQPR